LGVILNKILASFLKKFHYFLFIISCNFLQTEYNYAMAKKKAIAEKKIFDPMPMKKETVRIYGNADKAAAEQLYFTLLKEKNIVREVSKILNFPSNIIREWEEKEGWIERAKTIRKGLKRSLKDLTDESAVIRDNMLLRTIITKKLESAVTGKFTMSATEIKALNDMLEKINKAVLGEVKESPGHVVILMDKEAYKRAKELYGDKFKVGEIKDFSGEKEDVGKIDVIREKING